MVEMSSVEVEVQTPEIKLNLCRNAFEKVKKLRRAMDHRLWPSVSGFRCLTAETQRDRMKTLDARMPRTGHSINGRDR